MEADTKEIDRTTKEVGKVLPNALRLLDQTLPIGEIVCPMYYKIKVTTECTCVLYGKTGVTLLRSLSPLVILAPDNVSDFYSLATRLSSCYYHTVVH